VACRMISFLSKSLQAQELGRVWSDAAQLQFQIAFDVDLDEPR
jgi:hypothetical protein